MLLHIAAEIGDYNLMSAILWCEPYHNWTDTKNKHGSTVLHIAAIAGNTNGAELLVKHNKRLLEIQDNKGRTPLDKASEKGNLNTVRYLKEAANEGAKRVTNKNKLQELIEDQDWVGVYLKLGEREAFTKKINSNGNTLLHIAVEIGNDMVISEILKPHDPHYTRLYLYNIDLTNIKNNDGSTVLHIAAIVGNTNAAKILVRENKDLLYAKDNDGKIPLDKAYENMHLDTIAYLLEAIKDRERGKKEGQEASTVHPRKKKDADVEIGVDLLANAISAKRYDVALNLIGRYPEYAVFNDNVLMAMARTFPTGLDYGERLINPNLDNTSERIVGRTKKFFNSLVEVSPGIKETMSFILDCEFGFLDSLLDACRLILAGKLFITI
ncbi:uncharacterized protein LOC143569961 isoform X2 [Bidens hawaiensis]|uniref:uncharacterized protein LOC143569961 isoform X2 n=1 Tax=Bidens hawaiensis TaxID=980011 RepID=UPI00404A8AFD